MICALLFDAVMVAARHFFRSWNGVEAQTNMIVCLLSLTLSLPLVAGGLVIGYRLCERSWAFAIGPLLLGFATFVTWFSFLTVGVGRDWLTSRGGQEAGDCMGWMAGLIFGPIVSTLLGSIGAGIGKWLGQRVLKESRSDGQHVERKQTCEEPGK